MVKIVCKKGDNIYTLTVSTAIIEEVGNVKVYGIRIMGKYRTAEVNDISADYHYVGRLFDSGAFPKIIPFSMEMEQSCIA